MKRFLACVMSVVLAVGLVPVPALAAPGGLQAGSFLAVGCFAGAPIANPLCL